MVDNDLVLRLNAQLHRQTVIKDRLITKVTIVNSCSIQDVFANGYGANWLATSERYSTSESTTVGIIVLEVIGHT